MSFKRFLALTLMLIMIMTFIVPVTIAENQPTKLLIDLPPDPCASFRVS